MRAQDWRPPERRPAELLIGEMQPWPCCQTARRRAELAGHARSCADRNSRRCGLAVAVAVRAVPRCRPDRVVESGPILVARDQPACCAAGRIHYCAFTQHIAERRHDNPKTSGRFTVSTECLTHEGRNCTLNSQRSEYTGTNTMGAVIQFPFERLTRKRPAGLQRSPHEPASVVILPVVRIERWSGRDQSTPLSAVAKTARSRTSATRADTKVTFRHRRHSISRPVPWLGAIAACAAERNTWYGGLSGIHVPSI